MQLKKVESMQKYVLHTEYYTLDMLYIFPYLWYTLLNFLQVHKNYYYNC